MAAGAIANQTSTLSPLQAVGSVRLPRHSTRWPAAIVAKHRSGETGEVRLRFVSQFAKFENREVEGKYNLTSGLSPNISFDAGGAVILESKMNQDVGLSSDDENQEMFEE